MANNAYYEKFGFEVKRDIFLERGPEPVKLSIMVREPKKPKASASSSAAPGRHDVTATTVPNHVKMQTGGIVKM